MGGSEGRLRTRPIVKPARGGPPPSPPSLLKFLKSVKPPDELTPEGDCYLLSTSWLRLALEHVRAGDPSKVGPPSNADIVVDGEPMLLQLDKVRA